MLVWSGSLIRLLCSQNGQNSFELADLSAIRLKTFVTGTNQAMALKLVMKHRVVQYYQDCSEITLG